MGWLDCVIECTNKHGLDNFWACMIACSIEFPDEARRIGFLPAARAVAAGDGYTRFKGCEEFLKNTTEQPIKLLVTVCNTGQFSMDLDIDGNVIATIPEGVCQGIVVEIPAGKALHANSDGSWKAQGL